MTRLQPNIRITFDEIYEGSRKSVFYAIYLVVKSVELSEDLMQETYVDFLEKKIDKPLEESIALLVTMAKNKAINYYNRHKKEEEFINSLTSYSYYEDSVLDTGLLDRIKENLDDGEYELFLLRVLGEYSFKEISKLKKIPVGTLTWKYQESRKKLQKVFGE